MKPLIHTLYIIVAMAILSACSSAAEKNADRMAAATEAMEAGDNAAAKAICDDLLASSESSELSATQLARLSLMYMQLGERSDMDDNTATAFQCYRNAYKADADSAAIFYGSVSGDNARYVLILSSLLQIMENPDRNNVPDHEEGVESSNQ